MEGAEPEIFGFTLGLGVYHIKHEILRTYLGMGWNGDSIIEINLSMIVPPFFHHFPAFFQAFFHMFTFQRRGSGDWGCTGETSARPWESRRVTAPDDQMEQMCYDFYDCYEIQSQIQS